MPMQKRTCHHVKLFKMSTLELLHEVACIIFLNLVFALRMYHFVSAPQQAVHSEVCKRRATGEEYAVGGPSRQAPVGLVLSTWL